MASDGFRWPPMAADASLPDGRVLASIPGIRLPELRRSGKRQNVFLLDHNLNA